MEPTSEVVTARPTAALAAVIDRYVAYRMTGYAAGVHRGLPSRHMTFIVGIGPTIDVVDPRASAPQPDRYRCVLSGLQTASSLITHDGRQEGIAIELTPLGTRALVGMPAAALRETTVESVEVLGPAGVELWERLQSPAPWSRRFAVCDEILRRLVQPDRTVRPELSWVWQNLVRSAGNTQIGLLATEIGWSRQHLTRRFTQEFGTSPKMTGRIVRFERARRMIGNVPSSISLAQVAATCGYYDQAHLNRDFAELAGTTPTQWLAEEIPSVQDEDWFADRH